MAVHVAQNYAGWFVYDDRRHLDLDAEGRWRVVPWFFASSQEAYDALRLKTQRDEFAIR